jgi:cardiolipin synthase (CMP-forming)
MKKSNQIIETIKHPADGLWQKTMLKFIPNWIKPNHLSIIRLLLAPVVIWLIFERHYPAALLIFIISVLTDSLDGAIARTRRQITKLGVALDPLSDKLLITGCLIIFLFRYPFPELLASLIFFELIIIAVSTVAVAFMNIKAVPANIYGKIKMVLESAGLLAIFLWLMFPNVVLLLYLSALLLWLSLLLIILSALQTNRIMAEAKKI